MGYRGLGTRALLLAGHHRKKGLLTVKVPVVPRSGIRQGRPSTAPRQFDGEDLGGMRFATSRMARMAADHRGPCPCRGQPVSCGAHVPCGGAAAQRLTSRRAMKTASQQKPRRRPRAAAPSTGRGSCYDRASRTNPIAIAATPRRAATPMRSSSRASDGSSVPPQSGRFLVAPPCVARVATTGGRAPACHQEIGQCPTKCSSMRPIRRRPGWWFCAAIVSRNSTSSRPTVNSFAAISIWPR